MRTYQATPQDRERAWYVVDAENQTLGRLATQIAVVLRGKRKPTYSPHIDVGDRAFDERDELSELGRRAA